MHSDHHIDTSIQKAFKYPTVGILRNLKYLKAVSYTTVAILVFVLFITFQANQYSHGQTTSGNMSHWQKLLRMQIRMKVQIRFFIEESLYQKNLSILI